MTEALEKQVAINEVVDRSGSPNNKLPEQKRWFGFLSLPQSLSGTAWQVHWNLWRNSN